MMTHMCIDTSVRAARDHGYTVTLLEDACATRDLEWQGERIPADTVQKTMLAALNGTFARIMRVEKFLENMA
ncbi:Isochorismatase family protein [compost metagenome]